MLHILSIDRPALSEPLADQIERIAFALVDTKLTAGNALSLLRIADAVREMEGERHARRRSWWRRMWLR